MPNRIIKESICTSEEIESLSLFEEVMFYRLLVNCDDYGRYDARAAVLRSRLFPLKEVELKEVERALAHLEEKKLIICYEVNGLPYLQVTTWSKHQRLRNSKQKFPPPQLAATCGESRPESQSQSESESESESQSEKKEGGKIYSFSKAERDELSPKVGKAVERWLSYKKERGEPYYQTAGKAFLQTVKEKCDTLGNGAVVQVIDLSMSNNWKGLVWEKAPPKEKAKRETTYDLDEFEKLLGIGG